MNMLCVSQYDLKPRLIAIKALMELYGDWLFDRREFKDAGLGW